MKQRLVTSRRTRANLTGKAPASALDTARRAAAHHRVRARASASAEADTAHSTVDHAGGASLASERLTQAGRGRTVSLPGDVSRALATTLGPEISRVRLHADDEAAQLASEVGARAFSIGRDIYFGREELKPHAAQGVALLAHELAHAVRAPAWSASGPVRVGQAGSTEERTADQVATRALRSGVWGGLGQERRSALANGPVAGHTPLPTMASSTAFEIHRTPVQTPTPAVQVRHSPEALEAAKVTGTPEWMRGNVLAVYRQALAEAGTPELAYRTWEKQVWVALGQTPETFDRAAKTWLGPLVQAELLTLLKSIRAAITALRSEGAAARPEGAAPALPAGADPALTAELVQTLQVRVHALANAGTSEKAAELGLRVWTETLRLGAIQSFPVSESGLQTMAGQLPAALGQCMMGVASRTASDVELIVTDLPGELHVAAMNVVAGKADWIEDSALEEFVDAVLAEPAGVAYLEAHPDARESLVQKADALRAVGEVMVLQKEIWGVDSSENTAPEEQQYIVAKSSLPVDLKRWVQGGRDYQRSHYLIPTWKYYERYIQPFSFLGGSAGKRNGLHADLVARLPAVENTIRRRAEAANEAVGTFKFYGFRFALRGPGEHAMARAFDTRATANPQVRDPDTIALMGLLSGQQVSSRFGDAYGAINRRQAAFEVEFQTRLAELTPQLEADTANLAGLERERDRLKQQHDDARSLVKAAGRNNDSDEIRQARDTVEIMSRALEDLAQPLADAKAKLDATRAQLNAPIDGAASGDSATLLHGYDALETLESDLRAGWQAVAGNAGGDVAVIAANVDAKIVERLATATAKLNTNNAMRLALVQQQLGLRQQIASPAEIRRRTDEQIATLRSQGPLSAAEERLKRQAIRQTLQNEARAKKNAADALEPQIKALRSGPVQAQISSLTDLRTKLANPVHQRRLLSTGSDSVSLQSVGQVAKQGMNDLPKWLVAGFVDCGWTWGGAAWGNMNNFDSMHFEYPIRVAGGAI